MEEETERLRKLLIIHLYHASKKASLTDDTNDSMFEYGHMHALKTVGEFFYGKEWLEENHIK